MRYEIGSISCLLAAGILWALHSPGAAQTVTFTKITTGPLVTDVGSSFTGSWADYDGDGYLDLHVTRYLTGRSTLYHNNGDGTFTGVTNSVFPIPAGRVAIGGVWGDFDNDGWIDLSAPGVAASSTNFFNNGDGTFTPVYFDFTSIWNVSAVDYDHDGYLDLYITYGGGSKNQLYRNLGGRAFQAKTAAEVGAILGVSTYGGATWADYDDDGWVDVYAPSHLGSPCTLCRNDGAGRFVSVTNQVTSGTTRALTAAWSDYDNDGRVDLFLACFGGTSPVYRNLGNGDFARADIGVTIQGTYNGAALGDYDNDGFLDLFMTYGNAGRNALFHNNGNGTFTAITTGIIPNDQPVAGAASYSGLWFDYDNNGFLDLFVPNGNDAGTAQAVNFLYHNEGNANAWLRVKLLGTISNRDGAGAKVRAKATFAGQTRWQRRDITAGDNHNGNNFIAHFGLGDATNVETLRVEWPSGRVTELTNVAANQFLTLRERGVILDPQTVATAPGSNVTLRATVVSLGSPTLQWKLNGTNLPGATSDTLVLNNIQVGDAGTYTVEATDGTDIYPSNPCRVTVFDKPVITRQPQSLTVTNDSPASFTVAAISATPIRYQWRFNSAILTDRTNTTLTLTNVQAENDGEYDVVVSDDHGSTNSDPAQLTVLLKPRITLCATNYTVVQGGNLTLSVEATGELPVTYVWRRMVSVRERQTNDCHRSFFTLTNVQPTEDRTNNVYYLVNLVNIFTVSTGVQSDRIYITVLPDTDGDGMPDDWETKYPTCTEPDGDADKDGPTNLEEYLAGTDPTDPESYLEVERIAVNGEARIEFMAAENITYTVQYADSLPYTYTSAPLEIIWFTNNVPTSVTYRHDAEWRNAPNGSVWHTLTDVVAGPARTVVLTDPAASSHRFYRLVAPRQPSTN